MQKIQKYSLLFFICLLTSISVFSQQKFSGDPAAYPGEAAAMMEVTKNQECIEAGSALGGAWGAFSAAQQKKVVEVSQKMVKSKKLRANPHFRDFYLTLTAMQGKGMGGVQLDTFLIITDQFIETMQGPQMEVFFKTTKLITQQNLLYASNYNTLQVEGGSFAFQIKESKPAFVEEVPAPADTATENQFEDWDNFDQNEETWGTLDEEPAPTNEQALDVGYEPTPQPNVDGPVIVLKGVTLVITTPVDTVRIKNTSGVVSLKTGLFVGEGGTFDWSSVGLPNVYVDLGGFNFPIRGYRIVSEGSRLHYPEQTDSIPIGVFEYNSMKAKSYADKNYPRFKSFYSNIPVKGLDKNIEYHGGFSMSGKKIYSSSIDEGFSEIKILKGGEVKVKAVSNRFQLGDSLITSDYTKLVIYQGTDSIYHPGTILKYNKNSEFLRLTKTNGYRMAPFLDSYHKLEITADALTWNLNEDKIDFKIINGRTEIAALFESQEFYELSKYARLKGIYQFHPLQLIVWYSDKIKSREFPVIELADASKLPAETLKGAMIQLMKLGFVDYNSRTGLVVVKDKAFHYVLSSRDKKDYDNINFVSLTPSGANAELNLTSKSLIVHGVKRIYISDSLSVNFEPDSNTVEILANRDFKFNGKINTANFQFVGTDFEFNYDSFYVVLTSINAIKLAVSDEDTVDTKKSGKAKVLTNELRYSSGILYINKPNNKSARKRYAEYPIFHASTGASVFFNKKDIAKGAYDTTFQFKIPPFTVDSLSNNDPSVIGFDGTFESGGVFPPFEERLVVMPDYSLGFTHPTPPTGYKMYEGDAVYNNMLKLDNQGLRGNGEIKYLNTTLLSKDFVFFKDSTLTDGTSMVTTAGTNPLLDPSVTMPDVKIGPYRLMWKPKVDSMYMSSITEPFKLYDSTATFDGTLGLTHKGMYGKGVLSTKDSETESEKFHFEDMHLSAHDATFRIKSDNPEKPALKTVQSKLDYDLKKGIATFGPEKEGFASTEFPYAQYKTSIGKGTWDVAQRKIYLEASDSTNIGNSYFYTTSKEQDSLVFNASRAEYIMDSLTLSIYGIPYIVVNDGKITPDGHHVMIRENAVMQTLNNAVLDFDTLTNYHHLYDGNIDIFGRKNFNGEALYRYVNLGADTLQILFSNFKYTPATDKKNTDYLTTGIAQVQEKDSLFVGDKILYKGNITMKSPEKFLAFEGFIKLALKGQLSYSSWLKYTNTGTTNTVSLDLNSAVSERGNPLVTTLSFDTKSNQLYPNFISEKIHPEDQDLLPVTGIFQYHPDSTEFVVGSAEKLNGKSYKGNFLSYNDNTSGIKFGGKFDILKPDANVTAYTSGIGRAKLIEDEYSFNYFISFAFKGNTVPLAAMATNISSLSIQPPIQDEATAFEESTVKYQQEKDDLLFQKLAEFIEDAGVASYKSKRASGQSGISALSSNFQKGIVFSEIKMNWSPEYKAFYSVGPIELASILKTDINKAVKGYIEIKKSISGDIITIYLEPTYGNWYFIKYENNRLAYASSSGDVSGAIASKTKGEMPDRSKFFVVQAEAMEVNQFTGAFKEQYKVEDDYVEEPAYDPTAVTDSLPIGSDSLAMDSASVAKRKQLQLDDTNNTQQRVDESKPDEYKDNATDANQYKMQEQDTTYEEGQEGDQNKANNKSTIEEQQQKQRDQEQLKNLFK
ncbi:hypothetical protein [Cytophaga aurantiaca]|uniref:hypothetical protein n=1 Tax=Cytophaga aurantiaca TaxID=29530 RepID=UPI0003755E1C|nr:hypothetical protein [Cytophaga aurantiaca]